MVKSIFFTIFYIDFFMIRVDATIYIRRLYFFSRFLTNYIFINSVSMKKLIYFIFHFVRSDVGHD